MMLLVDVTFMDHYPDHPGHRRLRPHNQVLGGGHWSLHAHTSTSRLSGACVEVQSHQSNYLGGFLGSSLEVHSKANLIKPNDSGEFSGSGTWWKHVGCRRLSTHKVWVDQIVTQDTYKMKKFRFPHRSFASQSRRSTMYTRCCQDVRPDLWKSNSSCQLWRHLQKRHDSWFSGGR